ncbi:hypothetical protein F5X99DRAFT_378833 [Biscogniauxia marginata]|nr:hypothetical protein F5X99DRAFT_378833 [Biscogniauxia marginata]
METLALKILLLNPIVVAKVLLAAERQQQSIDKIYPAIFDLRRDEIGWITKRLVNVEGLAQQHWWMRKRDEVFMDGDLEYKEYQRRVVLTKLLPFIGRWRQASRLHALNQAVCESCA